MNAMLLAKRRGLAAPLATVWGYVRHELLFLCFALMEIALLTPVVLVGLGWARYWPAGQVALWLLLVMLLPLNLIRLMTLLQLDLKRQRRILMAALLLMVLFSWRQLLYEPAGLFDFDWLRRFATNLAETGNLVWARDLSIFILTTFVWWRGIRLATRLPEINNVGLRLRLGGLIFAPLLVWFTSSFLETSIVPFLLLFFLAALTAVALVRAENIEQEQRGTAATLNVRWFAVVFGAALLTLLVAGLLAVFLSGDSLFTIFGWFSPLWRALQFGGAIVLSVLFKLASPALDVLAVIVQFLGTLLAALIEQIGEGFRAIGIASDVATPAPPTPTGTPESDGPGLTGRVTAIFVMLGLIALVALALARAYRQATFAARDSQRSRITEDEEDDEPGLGRRVLERLGLLRQWRAAASIRRIYRLMCRAAASAGYPRLEAETPFEYLPSLSRVWPEYVAETRLITEAFVRIRYGELPETAEELEQIREAWRRIEGAEPLRRGTPAEGPTLAKREET